MMLRFESGARPRSAGPELLPWQQVTKWRFSCEMPQGSPTDIFPDEKIRRAHLAVFTFR